MNAFGGAIKAISKYISLVDPAASWTGADGCAAFLACSTNHMVDLDNTAFSMSNPRFRSESPRPLAQGA
ncbi:MAG: hypothetical protein AAGG57_08290 [Pseudomonadota bacterium]